MRSILSFDARVAFYCGVVTFASWSLLAPILDTYEYSTYPAWLGTAFFVGLSPFIPPLCIPAIQCRSWLRFIFALFCGAFLLFVDALASTVTPFLIGIGEPLMSLFVPCVAAMNPHFPLLPDPVNLGLTLLGYFVLLTIALAPTYRKTWFLGFSYFGRLVLGTVALFIVFALEPYESAAQLGLWESSFLSVIWLVSSGCYFAFVYGANPASKKAE